MVDDSCDDIGDLRPRPSRKRPGPDDDRREAALVNARDATGELAQVTHEQETGTQVDVSHWLDAKRPAFVIKVPAQRDRHHNQRWLWLPRDVSWETTE